METGRRCHTQIHNSLFQSLVGSVETCQSATVRSKSWRFQSLVGSVETEIPGNFILCTELFQSLVGSVETRQHISPLLVRNLVSISGR